MVAFCIQFDRKVWKLLQRENGIQDPETTGSQRTLSIFSHHDELFVGNIIWGMTTSDPLPPQPSSHSDQPEQEIDSPEILPLDGEFTLESRVPLDGGLDELDPGDDDDTLPSDEEFAEEED